MKSRRQNVSVARQTILGRDENFEPIPVDLVIEIFSRSPVKSIARCRCVSKLWASILRLPYFTELYLTKSCARPRLLFACQKHRELFFFSTPQPHNPNESSSPLAASFHMKIPFDGRFNIISPIGGLVFIRHEQILKGRKTPEFVSAICNPSTGQSLTLPKPKTRKRIWGTSHFGYDPIEKQFKVLSMNIGDGVYKEHYVLTLGTENLSWRRIECSIPHVHGSKGICINGVLYYRAKADMFSGTLMIVCFDVRFEKFSYIKILKPTTTLISYNGKLASLVWEGPSYICGKRFEMWVLGDPEKHEWLKHTYELRPRWQNVLGEDLLIFAGMTGTNEIVLSPKYPSHPFYVFYYNLERNTIRRVEIQGMGAFKVNEDYIFLDHVEDVKLI